MVDSYIFNDREPVLVKNSDVLKAKWLFVTKKIVFDGDPNRKVSDIITNPTEGREESVFELKDEGLLRCRKCGATVISNTEDPAWCAQCERSSTFDVLTKKIDPDFWKIPTWVDMPVTKDVYQELYDVNKKCVVFVEDIQYKIFTLSIISSYFMDQWETIGYLAFIGLIESGKSRALDIIAETGWRIMNAGSGISFPAMVRGTHIYGAGVLVDEAHDKLTSSKKGGYSEKCQEMIDFLKPGYRRGSHYIIADKEDPGGIISYNNFGFKAFAGEREFDRATMSRCIVFQMEQDYPEIQNLKDIREQLNTIQTKLVNLKYKRNEPIPQIPADLGISGRNLEIFHPIIRTAMYLGIDHKDIVEYAKQRKIEEVEEFRNSEEYEILKAIKGGEENEKLFDAPEKITYSELCARMGKEYERETGQRIGYILNKKLQLRTKRENTGTVLLLNDPKNERKLKYLYRRYKV